MSKNVCYLLIPTTDVPQYDADGNLAGVIGLTEQAFNKFRNSNPEWPAGWWMPGTRAHNGKRPVQLLMTRQTDLDTMNDWLTTHGISWTVGLLHKDNATLLRRENGTLVLKGGEPQNVLRNWKAMSAAFLNWMADVWNEQTQQFERPIAVTQFHHWCGHASVGQGALEAVIDDVVPDDTPDEP